MFIPVLRNILKIYELDIILLSPLDKLKKEREKYICILSHYFVNR